MAVEERAIKYQLLTYIFTYVNMSPTIHYHISHYSTYVKIRAAALNSYASATILSNFFTATSLLFSNCIIPLYTIAQAPLPTSSLKPSVASSISLFIARTGGSACTAFGFLLLKCKMISKVTSSKRQFKNTEPPKSTAPGRIKVELSFSFFGLIILYRILNKGFSSYTGVYSSIRERESLLKAELVTIENGNTTETITQTSISALILGNWTKLFVVTRGPICIFHLRNIKQIFILQFFQAALWQRPLNPQAPLLVSPLIAVQIFGGILLDTDQAFCDPPELDPPAFGYTYCLRTPSKSRTALRLVEDQLMATAHDVSSPVSRFHKLHKIPGKCISWLIETLPQIDSILICQHKVAGIKHGCIRSTGFTSGPYFLASGINKHQSSIRDFHCVPTRQRFFQIASRKLPLPAVISLNPKAKSPEADSQREPLVPAVIDEPREIFLWDMAEHGSNTRNIRQRRNGSGRSI
ncbi:hypothetical protein RJ641_034101 [Dillenia turbinata]|uniref:Uncharacterized protein n=1 Tax=Dillenia turbinata TaxID=194707 RepID=A0AAN8VVZ0_9MAGN